MPQIRAFLAVEQGLEPEDFAGLVAADDMIRLLGVAEGFEKAWHQLSEETADVLVVACLGYSDRTLVFLDTVTKAAPERPVIVLGQGSPAGFVRRVFEMGAEDILLLPQKPADVSFAIQKAYVRRHGGIASGKADLGRLVVVLGPKGGTGKTLVATNFAVVLAQRGYRAAIVDLDLQFGDVGLSMGLPPEATIHELSVASGTVDEDKLAAYLTMHSSGVRALLAPNRPDKASTVSSQLLLDVFGTLRASTDFTIVDTPPGFTPEVITTIDTSTDLIMVGMLDSLSLKNTKLGLETLELMGYEQERIKLILNRAHSRVGISQSDVVAVLGREPDVYVPSDREIPRAINEGVPIVVARPQSEAALAFERLADQYVGPVTNGTVPAARQGRKSLFSMLAGKRS